jgi:hypothetical protein
MVHVCILITYKHFCYSHCLLHLHNVLHVPRATKHLVFMHQFNLDNHTFIELHPHFFLINDLSTRTVLLLDPVTSHP